MNSIKTLLALFCMGCLLCSCEAKDDTSTDPDPVGPTGKGSVSITNVEASKSATLGYRINVSITTSGVAANEIESLGATVGTTTGGTGLGIAHISGGKTSGSCTLGSNLLTGKTQYYVKAFLTTSSGKVYSAVKSVKTP